MTVRVYQTQTGAFTARHGHQGALSEQRHQHRFTYDLTFSGPVNAEGFLLDFRPVADVLRTEVDGRLEGTDLGVLLPNPTTEALAVWIFNRLSGLLPHVYSVKVAEEPDRWITYRGEE